MTRPCKAPACEYQWFTSQWSNCSADCGKGVQTRNVVCGQFVDNAIKPAEDESKCKSEKPEGSKECDTQKECPGQWFSGPWSSCDKPCGGGTRTRKVMCIANGKAVPDTQCKEDTIEFSREDCNKQPCLEDETIPVDTTSQPIIEDDESEELCPDEDEEDTTDSLELIDMSSIDTSTLTEESTGSESTESSLITDDLMLSDSTSSTDTDETDSSSDGSTDISCKRFLLNLLFRSISDII